MRITRQQLTDLINEEISSALLERQNRRLLEEFESDLSQTDQITLQSMLAFAKKYHAIALKDQFLVDQLDNIVNQRGETMTEEDVELLMNKFKGMSTELDGLFADAMAAAQVYEDEDDDGTWAAAVRANR